MASFAELVATPEREEVLLLELSALLTVTGWTGTAGQPNTYEAAVANVTAPPAGHEALYRRVVGVRQGSVELTAQASIAAVNGAAGSWYWDEAVGKLYVRTSGSAVDPDTLPVVAARVTFYLASTGIVLDRVDGDGDTGIWWRGDLAPATVPTNRQEADDLFSGLSTAWAGEAVALNGHRAWMHLAAPGNAYTWRNQKAVFKAGGRYRGQALLLSQYQTVATMLIEDMVPDEHVVRFALKPFSRLADLQVPVTPIFEAEYPNLGDGVRGLYKPFLYGRAWTKPLLTDVSGYGTWTIADAAYQTLYQVHQVEAIEKSGGRRVPLSLGQDYTVNLTACTVTLVTDQYPVAAWGLAVDATGEPNKASAAGGGAGARGYLSTASEIIRDLLHSVAGLAAADLDTAAFDQAHLDAPEELAVYLASPRALTSVFSTDEDLPSIERSVQGVLGQTPAGLFTFRVWDPIVDTTVLTSLRKQDLAAFQPDQRIEKLTTGTRVWFALDGRFDTFDKVDYVDTVQRDLTGVTDIWQVWTFLANQGDAEVLANRYEFADRYAPVELDFAEAGALLALASVGDRVLVTYDPAATDTGAYTDQVMQLVRLERGYAPRITVAGRLVDIGRIINRAGRWKGAGAPTYAAATAAERLVSGFWGGSSSTLGWQ